MIITHQFIKEQLLSMTRKEMRLVLQRQRLKFSIDELSLFVFHSLKR